MVLEVKKPRPLWEIIFSTHHTDIGLLYIILSISFLMMGGALALAIRAELFLPGQQIIPDPNAFHRFFTVHGTTMLFLWAIPFAAGIGNYLDDSSWRCNGLDGICRPWLDCLSTLF
jgi:cytochrome c oxidase subunit 1